MVNLNDFRTLSRVFIFIFMRENLVLFFGHIKFVKKKKRKIKKYDKSDKSKAI